MFGLISLYLVLSASAAQSCCGVSDVSGKPPAQPGVATTTAECAAPSDLCLSSGPEHGADQAFSSSRMTEQAAYGNEENEQLDVCENSLGGSMSSPKETTSSVMSRSTEAMASTILWHETSITSSAVLGTTSPVPVTGNHNGEELSTGTCSKASPCKGKATNYDTATSSLRPSSCGWTNDGTTEDVIAVPAHLIPSYCGHTITINYGGYKTGTIVDTCVGCGTSSIDLSRHLFGQLANLDTGVLYDVEWWIA
ncbi:hypothetical protein BDV24DRAFT_170161 [Aspergillus arachidicola]|uniref:Uncharacterized protein n=1 Tax=Aspergillus arachidicola TaxID=656916 RepID=A0A5N6XNL6_9EURO|nr:hypothetical protein BDV24DRAFT_170161 [Aspergillus arachidicola]